MRQPPDLATAATQVTSVAAAAALAYKLTAEASLHAAAAAAASTNHAAEWNAVLPNVKMGEIGASEELPRPCAVCRVAKVLCDREQPCSRCRRLGFAHMCQPPPFVKRGRPSHLSRLLQLRNYHGAPAPEDLPPISPDLTSQLRNYHGAPAPEDLPRSPPISPDLTSAGDCGRGGHRGIGCRCHGHTAASAWGARTGSEAATGIDTASTI